MTARVLVVDDVAANVKLLAARLSAEYFDVLTASNGPEALAQLGRGRVDVVLLDVMMPGMDGFEVCRRIKADARTQHVPVVMVTALDQTADRVQGLQAGADDFLTKPVDDIALITRVKNLSRLKILTDELVMRAATGEQLGLMDLDPTKRALDEAGRVLLVEDQPRWADRFAVALSREHDVDVEPDPQQALFHVAENDYDLLMVSLSLAHADGLRLCSQARSLDRTRHLPILVMVEPGDVPRLVRALDLGVNDYLVRPIDRNEMMARVRTQVRRKRYQDVLRTKLDETVEQALTDPLTGLHNRRYMETHLRNLLAEARQSHKPLAVLVADIDHFKQVNDVHGHDNGDAVLKQFAERVRQQTRTIDLACRMGGEEFLIIMPDTDRTSAMAVAERLRHGISAAPFRLATGGDMIDVTASLGVSVLESRQDTVESLIKRADQALYAAKRSGRNRVVADAA